MTQKSNLNSRIKFSNDINKSSEEYLTSKDNIKLFYKKWEAENKVRGNILLIHGFGEHIGRYNDLCKKFTDIGFSVYGIDLRGHGKSSGKRGYASSYNLFLKDINVLYEKVIKENANSPIILYGHSFGGNLVINYLLTYPQNKISAAIITSPWLKLSFKPPLFKIILGNIIKHLFPYALTKMNLNVNGLSPKPEVTFNYINDPLIHNKINIKLFYQISNAGIKAIKQIYKVNTPILILHGINDPITSHKASMELIKNASDKITLKLYNISFHELHNTDEVNAIFNDIIIWLSLKNI